MMHGKRSIADRGTLTVAFALSFALTSSLLFAHMRVAKTVPQDGATISAAPEAIQVWFTQEPDRAVSKLTLTGPPGEVELEVHSAQGNSLMGMVEQKNLRDGVYTVAWQAAGDDGHIQKGEFTFTLKTP